MTPLEEIRQLLLNIVRSLVDYPELIIIEEVPKITCTIFRVSVAREDIGKLIGSHGRNARAIRVIMAGAARTLHQPVEFEIVEENAEREPLAETLPASF